MPLRRSRRICTLARLCPVALIGFAASVAAGQTPAATADTPPKVAPGVATVHLPVVVLDKKGPVAGLTAGDFALEIAGKPQPISAVEPASRLPVTYGLLMDTGRDAQEGLPEEIEAAQKFVATALRPATADRAADKAFVLQFSHGVELLQDVTASPSSLAAGLKEVGTQAPGAEQDADAEQPADTSQGGGQGRSSSYPGGRSGGYPGGGGYPGRGGSGGNSQRTGDHARGGVVLYDALYLSADEVLRKQKGRRVLVVVTGGVDRHSKESLHEALEAAQHAGVVVYGIYSRPRSTRTMNDGAYDPFGMPRMPGSGREPGSDGTYADPDGRKILQQFADATGGRVFERKGKNSLAEILEEIRHDQDGSYVLQFVPGTASPGSELQKVDLTLTRPDLRRDAIQTANGIYAASRPDR